MNNCNCNTNDVSIDKNVKDSFITNDEFNECKKKMFLIIALIIILVIVK